MVWKSDISDANKLEANTAELFLSLAQKRVEDTLDTFNSISQRTNILIASNISVLSLIIGFLVDGVENRPLRLSLIIFCIFLISSLVSSAKNLKSSSIWTAGVDPKGIVKGKFLKKEKQFEKLCISLCKHYQEKIMHNRSINRNREKNVIRSTRILIFSPLSFLLGIGLDLLSC